MTSKHRLDISDPQPASTATVPKAEVAASSLQSIPIRPRGARRYAAPALTPGGSAAAHLPSRRAVRVQEQDAQRPAKAPGNDLEWPTHPTRRELRIARESGPDRPRGYTGKIANWRAPAPMPAMSMASEFGPFPVYVPDLKDFRVNWALSLLLGPLGVDRFHRGHYFTGALKFLTLGGAGIWWATDQLAVASGRAVTRGNHPMTGRRAHRVLAGAVSVAVIAGAGGAAIATLAPHTDEAKDLLLETVAPEPLQPTWEPLASLSGPVGTTASNPFTVTGDGVTFDYVLKDAGFVYLLPADAAEVTEDMVPMVSTLIADTGSITKALAPGEYILVVKSPIKPWSVQVSQRVLR